MLFILMADVLLTKYIHLKQGKLEISQREVEMGEDIHPIARVLWGKIGLATSYIPVYIILFPIITSVPFSILHR